MEPRAHLQDLRPHQAAAAADAAALTAAHAAAAAAAAAAATAAHALLESAAPAASAGAEQQDEAEMNMAAAAAEDEEQEGAEPEPEQEDWYDVADATESESEEAVDLENAVFGPSPAAGPLVQPEAAASSSEAVADEASPPAKRLCFADQAGHRSSDDV